MAVDGVQGLLLALAGLVQAGSEGVLLSAQPALAGEIDLRDIAGAAGNFGGLLELHEWGAVDQRLDVQVGESDQVSLLLAAGPSQGVKSVSDLLNLDGAGEGCLLGVVSLKLVGRACVNDCDCEGHVINLPRPHSSRLRSHTR